MEASTIKNFISTIEAQLISGGSTSKIVMGASTFLAPATLSGGGGAHSPNLTVRRGYTLNCVACPVNFHPKPTIDAKLVFPGKQYVCTMSHRGFALQSLAWSIEQ